MRSLAFSMAVAGIALAASAMATDTRGWIPPPAVTEDNIAFEPKQAIAAPSRRRECRATGERHVLTLEQMNHPPTFVTPAAARSCLRRYSQSGAASTTTVLVYGNSVMRSLWHILAAFVNTNRTAAEALRSRTRAQEKRACSKNNTGVACRSAAHGDGGHNTLFTFHWEKNVWSQALEDVLLAGSPEASDPPPDIVIGNAGLNERHDSAEAFSRFPGFLFPYIAL